jgi:hypothetical protein
MRLGVAGDRRRVTTRRGGRWVGGSNGAKLADVGKMRREKRKRKMPLR